VVEPGIVLDVLNNQLKPAGLRFGPEPATHMNCTLGGMIGNNSCGATAQRTGKVVDNIAALEVLLYDGTRFWCGPTSDDEFAAIERRGDQRARIYRRLRQLRDTYGDQIRATYPDIPRRVSGYNLDSLLPEHGFDVAGLLVGSESTLVTVLRAKLKLVDVLTERSLVALGWLPLAARAVSRLRLAPVVNTLTHTPGLHRAATLLGGLEHREVPLFAGETLQQWYVRRGPRGDGHRGTVVLWPDTFSNHFHPHVGQAAVEVLESAGWQVSIPEEPVCCGLTWISTGQLATGKRILQKTVAALAPHVRSGGYVVGLEPSCAAVR
jgi:FAD/FMN-containing dehydrogenase